MEDYYDPSDPTVTLPREETLVELYTAEIQDYLTANYPDLTLAYIRRTQDNAPEELGMLPASLPYIVRTRDMEFAEIPADRRYRLRFHLRNGGTTLLNHTVNLPEVAGRRITIDYVGATMTEATRTVKVRATVDNAEGLLRPGTFCEIRVGVSGGDEALAVPRQALL